MAGHVERDTVGGVVWLAAAEDDLEVGFAGALTRGTEIRSGGTRSSASRR